MTTESLQRVNILGVLRQGDYDLYEAIVGSIESEVEVYSCIAICRTEEDGNWPALGGTRCYTGCASNVRHEAIELARSMHIKNTLLRKAEASLNLGAARLFGWKGGKGVIWLPTGFQVDPVRLRTHGKLVESLGGRYMAAGDVGIGAPQLQAIRKETSYVIGLGCKRDSGEATAYGVLSGLQQAIKEMEQVVCSAESLKDVPVLVVGAGKVGLPLILLLMNVGADVYVYDSSLRADQGCLKVWISETLRRGAAVDEVHYDCLVRLLKGGRIFESEEDALSSDKIHVISPNGGSAEWLSQMAAGGVSSRADLIAQSAQRGGVRLILGAGNDQVSTAPGRHERRDLALGILRDAGVVFVPDPIVSPGGVVAVSHELNLIWDKEAVNRDSQQIVARSVGQVFRESRKLGGTDAETMYKAFCNLVDLPWD